MGKNKKAAYSKREEEKANRLKVCSWINCISLREDMVGYKDKNGK